MSRSSALFRRSTGSAALLTLAALFSSACGDSTSPVDGAGALHDASFTDGSSQHFDLSSLLDTTPPTVLSTNPAGGATGVADYATIEVTFSEAMAPATINATSFTVKQGVTAVPGAVTYAGTTATFKPAAALALNQTFVAEISVAATDLAGNPLAAIESFSFTTDPNKALGPAPVLLGASGQFAILAKSAVSTVPISAVTGDIGLSPAAASFVTGFSLTRAGTYWTSPQVVGEVFAADNDPPTPTNLTTAVGDMQTAYTDAAGRPTPDFLNLGAGAIGGLTLVPGLYNWSSTVTVPTDVTLSGGANDTWIFQTSGDLTVAAGQKVLLVGGARAKNVVWQVAGIVKLGTTAHLEGIVLCQTAITLGTGASINGRLLAQTAVSLDGSTVTVP